MRTRATALPRATAILSATVTLTLAAGAAGFVGQAVAAGGDDSAFAGAQRVFRQSETGAVGFVGTSLGKPIKTGAAAGTPAAAIAKGYLNSRAKDFGIAAPGNGLAVAEQHKTVTGSAVRLNQTYQGVPVLGGQYVVNVDESGDVLSALGESSPVTGISTTPSVTAAQATKVARQVSAKDAGDAAATFRTSTPALRVFDPRLLGGPSLSPAPRLVWVVETRGETLGKYVAVDAHLGKVALSFDLYQAAKNRIVCDLNNVRTLTVDCGTLQTPVVTEANPPTAASNANVQKAFEYAGDTYDFFSSRFGRDSLDGNGLQLRSTVRFCDTDTTTSCPYDNAYWDGTQMVYGDGFATGDDVVAHELSHGFTTFTSNLFYYYQSGAINESMSDVFGEFVDQTNGHGTDTAAVRWQLGEDLPASVGVIRNMKDPTQFNDPDRMLSPNYEADPNGQDSGGVHYNSGVNNKAVYLMTDGDTFNGQTVTGMGLTKTARLYYTVERDMLTSAADYADLANALRQACTNLATAGTDGFTAADCTNTVAKAVLATQMDQNPTAAPTRTAMLCPIATDNPVNVWFDDIENVTTQFTKGITTGATQAWYAPANPNVYNQDMTYATSGKQEIWGDNDQVLSNSWISMTNAVTIPAGAYLNFNHAYGFEHGTSATANFDGGLVEYSTNAGASWTDAGPLFTAADGANGYNGTISTSYDNPSKGKPAFVRTSNGYGSSRASLAALAGQSVKFRWRIATDSVGADYGWFLDDLRINTCSSTPVSTTPTSATSAPSNPTTATSVPTTGPTSAPPDTTPPQTTITRKPKKVTTRRKFRFRFVSSEAGSTFVCGVDKKKAAPCTSPLRTKVKPGRHVFKVWAIDKAGNKDATPAVWKWRVKRR